MVTSSKPFHILMRNILNKTVYVLKYMLVTITKYSLAHNIMTSAAFLEADAKTIGAAHYKPSPDKDTQITRYNKME